LEARRTISFKTFEWFWQSQLGISVLSLGLSVLLLLIMSLMFGAHPLYVLLYLFEGALKGQRSIVATLGETAVIILAGLAVLLPIRAGFFNVGGQGQIEIGALAAVVVATNLQGPPVAVILFALFTAMIAGALVVLVPLVLKLKRGASEVTTTIMMNFACIQLVHAMITGALKDPESFYGSTLAIQESYRLPLFPMALGTHAGVWVAFAIAVLIFLLMSRTVFGVQLKAVGSNPTAARATGISVNKVLICSVLLGAALAGLAGGIQAMGVTYKVAEGWSKTWGFIGIPVAFLGGNGLGVIPVAFLLAIMETGARYMQAMTGVPAAMVHVFQGIPVLVFICLTARRVLYSKKQSGD
jgi:simple sugar transport system permease protein